MEEELDDDTLLIELHCLINSTSKIRFTKDTVIDEPQYIDDPEEVENQLHPGPNFIHPNEVRLRTILTEYDRLAQKYGKKHFDTFLRNLYTTYPTPDPNISAIEYLNQLKEGRPQFHMKWAYIYDFMHSINEYFVRKGETL
ncbi:uncharacterized protein METZ01_LOCUS352311 [marine metagenome]|uniref:Uncharacterized protein n=1 Tax=marine metagenome TaxID=408172 RepID=A0A382RQX6_9ZZZZ